MASRSSMRDSSIACSAAPSRWRLSMKPFRQSSMAPATSACRLSCDSSASSATPGQRSSSLTVKSAASGKWRLTCACISAMLVNSSLLTAVEAVPLFLPNERRHSTLPREVRPMIASRSAGSTARKSSFMRNCRSRKREFTLFSSIVMVPLAVSRLATA